MADTHEERLRRARIALEGLSVGDALGGFFEFSRPGVLPHFIKTRQLPVGQWHFTDDTNMALSIYEVLRRYSEIKQDELALSFARYYDRSRGYGPSIHSFVPRILSGQHWREAAKSVFRGQGSFGNGGAMRVSPVGAYFADDLEQVVEQARLSCEITHAHPEGLAGAVAIAVATALAWRLGEKLSTQQEFIETILPYLPESDVAQGIQRALNLPKGTSVQDAVSALSK